MIAKEEDHSPLIEVFGWQGPLEKGVEAQKDSHA